MTNTDLNNIVDDNVLKEGMNKISYVIHSLFPFFGLKKKAVDLYYKEIEKSNLSSEMKFYILANFRHNSKQLESLIDIGKIAIDNAESGTNFTMSSKVDEEWLERFMDSAKFVTDSQVKVVWGKILSKEFETLGCISPNVISILPSITSKYACLFGLICDMQVEIVHEKDSGEIKRRNECIIPIQNDMDFFSNKGLSFFSLNELESLGLIRLHLLKDYIIKCNDKKLSYYYFGKKVTFNVENRSEFPIGSVMLTDAGKIIRDVTERKEQEGYFTELKNYYLRKGICFEEET